MADKWIIKPTGPNQLDVTVPDSFAVEEELASVTPQQLLRALAEWLELQEAGGKFSLEVEICGVDQKK